MSERLNTKSRVTGDCHARFCERLEVRSPRPTRQYFIGLEEFTAHPVFDPSLFVDIRKRVGHETFDMLTVDLIKSVSQEKDKRHNKKNKKDDGDEPKNKGKMQADATVADQYITFPTDNGILNASRKK
ncbi:MAG: hypothetical protein B6I32_09210, partial [Desulfobacterium sp. 4572_20]